MCRRQIGDMQTVKCIQQAFVIVFIFIIIRTHRWTHFTNTVICVLAGSPMGATFKRTKIIGKQQTEKTHSRTNKLR